MNRQIGFTGVGILILVATAIVVSSQGQKLRPSGSPQNPGARELQKGDPGVSESVFYEQVFSSISILKNAEDYREGAGLDDRQLAIVTQTAADCAQEIAQLDSKALAVIEAFHAKAKGLKPGMSLPDPPTELEPLQKARDETILRHRNNLQNELGDAKFLLFKSTAQRIVKVELRQLPAISR